MGTPTEAGILEPELRPQPGGTTIPGLAADEPGPETPEDLAGALWELGQAEAWAQEEDLPTPTPEALRDTEILLRQLYRIYPFRYNVNPSDFGDMMIHAGPEYGRSLLVVRRANGTAWCTVCAPEKAGAIRYNSEDFISEKTLREAVAVLKGEKKP